MYLFQSIFPNSTPCDTDGWNSESVHAQVLDSIGDCLADIVNLMGATSVTHAMVNRLPRGVDKLLAARYASWQNRTDHFKIYFFKFWKTKMSMYLATRGVKISIFIKIYLFLDICGS